MNQLNTKERKNMENKVTKKTLTYPKGYEPDYIIPKEYCEYRFILGKRGQNPLVAICMNPSAARETFSDRTVNINISKSLKKDGWIVFNTYPERATKAGTLDDFKQQWSDQNIKEIKKYIMENNIKEVWVAWGDDNNIESLKKGKQQLQEMLFKNNIKMYYFGSLTKSGNPRHPLQRYEKWDFSEKKYLKYKK